MLASLLSSSLSALYDCFKLRLPPKLSLGYSIPAMGTFYLRLLRLSDTILKLASSIMASTSARYLFYLASVFD